MPRPRNLISLALALPLLVVACKKNDETNVPEYSPTPTPRQVCEHLAQLIVAEIGPVDPAVQEETVASCTVDMTQEERMRGPQEWDLVARCVLDSNNEADIDRCDQLYPAPAGAQTGGQPAVAATREEEACVHMISTVLIEGAAANGGQVADLTDAELAEMHQACLAAFAEDRQTMTGAQYDGMVNCILGSTTVAQMEACGTM